MAEQKQLNPDEDGVPVREFTEAERLQYNLQLEALDAVLAVCKKAKGYAYQRLCISTRGACIRPGVGIGASDSDARVCLVIDRCYKVGDDESIELRLVSVGGLDPGVLVRCQEALQQLAKIGTFGKLAYTTLWMQLAAILAYDS